MVEYRPYIRPPHVAVKWKIVSVQNWSYDGIRNLPGYEGLQDLKEVLEEDYETYEKEIERFDFEGVEVVIEKFENLGKIEFAKLM